MGETQLHHWDLMGNKHLHLVVSGGRVEKVEDKTTSPTFSLLLWS